MKLSELLVEKKVGRGIDPTTARPVTSTNQAWIPKFSRGGKKGDIFLATSVIKMGARKKWVGAIFNLDTDYFQDFETGSWNTLTRDKTEFEKGGYRAVGITPKMKKQLADIFNDPSNESNKEEMSRVDREVLRKYFKN